MKTLTKSKHQGSKQSPRKSKHQNPKNKKCEIAKISLTIARVQMSNTPAVTKPRGSRRGSLVGSRHPLSLGVTFGSRPGVGGSKPVNSWFLEFCFFTAAGLTAALSMTFQQAGGLLVLWPPWALGVGVPRPVSRGAGPRARAARGSRGTPQRAGTSATGTPAPGRGTAGSTGTADRRQPWDRPAGHGFLRPRCGNE